jgi:HK97 family phage portal protein
MGILSSLKNISISRSNPRDPVVADWWGLGRQSAAGVNVTPDRAMQIVGVYACIRILSESVAMLPLHLYRTQKKQGRRISQIADDIPLYGVLHDQPNRYQTSFEFREMMTGHVALRGNAYAKIIPAPANPVAELIPLHPDRVMPFKHNDNIVYRYQPENGETEYLLSQEVFHLRGLSSDGLVGIDPISQAREALGVAVASEEFGARFFGNNTVIGGTLEHPAELSDKAYKRLVEEFERRHMGSMNAHRPAILEEGMKWSALGIEPEKAQFLETRKFQITEIARMFRIPPHMLADLERATFSNIEQQSMDFVVNTLMPWLIRWEQAIQRCLMTSSARRNLYPKFKVQGLLRGDTKTRYESYQMAAGGQAPWMTRNEIRIMEDLNPLDGLDEMMQPLNMQSGTDQMANAAAERLARKETIVLRNLWQKTDGDVVKFFELMRDFMADFAGEVAQYMAIDDDLAKAYCDSGLVQLENLAPEDLSGDMKTWEKMRTANLLVRKKEENDALPTM